MPMDGVTTDADGPTHDSRIIGGDSVHPSVFYKPSIWSADNIIHLTSIDDTHRGNPTQQLADMYPALRVDHCASIMITFTGMDPGRISPPLPSRVSREASGTQQLQIQAVASPALPNPDTYGSSNVAKAAKALYTYAYPRVKVLSLHASAAWHATFAMLVEGTDIAIDTQTQSLRVTLKSVAEAEQCIFRQIAVRPFEAFGHSHFNQVNLFLRARAIFYEQIRRRERVVVVCGWDNELYWVLLKFERRG
ncbi:hypothetical protein B0H13DRAFT_2344848 [Mycena leptocephala]|nr:hypothetical protein B0H13DRAFT_2344848 [Mycena leptocephala]